MSKAETKTWVVFLKPFEGGFNTVRVEEWQDEEEYKFVVAAHPRIIVPQEADVKDEIGAFMYAKRILDNLQLNEGAKT